MDEMEIPTEHLHETIKEKAEEDIEKGAGRFTLYVAVCTALMAVFAALAGLMAGDHSTEALIEQVKASDQWGFYQAKSIKAEIRVLQGTSGSTTNKSPDEIKKEEAEIKKTAEEYQQSSQAHLKRHVWLARAVTLFQVAIAISAISILTKKKFLWFAGVGISVIGLAAFIMGLL